MVTKLNETKKLLIIYITAFGFLLSTPYFINFPVDDEAGYVLEAKLLMEGKTQPNYNVATSYITLLLSMPIIKFAFSFFNLRLLMMLVGALSAPLMYLILREFQIKGIIAFLGSLVLITSPFVAFYLRKFMTDSPSLVLYLLATLFFTKGIKTDTAKFIALGSVVSIIAFLDRQFSILPAVAAFVFLLRESNKNYIIASLPIIFALGFFAFTFMTTGSLTVPITAPHTNPIPADLPQFGLNIQSPFRILQDAIFLGFLLLPFAVYTAKHVKPQIIVIVGAIIFASLATLSGEAFIIYANIPLVFLATLIFSYSGINLILFAIQTWCPKFSNLTQLRVTDTLYLYKYWHNSKIINYAFIIMIGGLLFTIFKTGPFSIKYYSLVLPSILIFLALKIRKLLPFILTIVVLGSFGTFMVINKIQFYDALWNEVNGLLYAGVNPEDIQGHYTVVNWLTGRIDNPEGTYKITGQKHWLLNEFFGDEKVLVEKLK